jgi:hypothetical protein
MLGSPLSGWAPHVEPDEPQFIFSGVSGPAAIAPRTGGKPLCYE